MENKENNIVDNNEEVIFSSKKETREKNYAARFRDREYKTTHIHTGESWIDEKDKIPDDITKEKVNILAHPQYKIDSQITENLDWNLISQTAIENKVAIEINIQDFMKKAVNKAMTDLETFPLNQTKYEEFIENRLNAIPLISSPIIMNQLRPYFEKGLKIAINTDEHKMFYQPREGFTESQEKYNCLLPEGSIKIDDPEDKPKIRRSLNIRFWKIMKIVEKYFNEKFLEYNISKENIINLYSPEKMDKFIKKEK